MEWWFFTGLETNGSRSCREDVARIELYTTADASRSFPCKDGRGHIEIPPDGHDIFARAIDATGALITETPVQEVWSGFEARFYELAGFARVEWQVNATAACTGMPLHASFVQGNHYVYSEAFACPAQGAPLVLAPIPLDEGMYTATFHGLNGHVVMPLEIGRDNAITDLDVTTP